MPDSPTSERDSAFVCACDARIRSACSGEPFYKQHESKRYCVLHFPGNNKSADFEKAFQNKLDRKDFNFRGVWFPGERSFTNFTFSSKADFRRATFGARVTFDESSFSAEADFS